MAYDPDTCTRAGYPVLHAALAAAGISRWPAAFSGSDLDTEANRKRLESLVHRIEELAALCFWSGRTSEGEAALSPTVRLAAMLKEALAANTIGGKVDDGSRWRAALGGSASGASELVARRPGA